MNIEVTDKAALRQKLINTINEAVKALFGDIKDREVIDQIVPALEFPGDIGHGDYSTNIAMVLAKKLAKNPRELAVHIIDEINKKLAGKDPSDIKLPEVSKVEVAGPGFINFHLSRQCLADSIGEILKEKDKYGWAHIETGIEKGISTPTQGKTSTGGAIFTDKKNLLGFGGKKVLVEYTDPNPFKPFHIGHLMSNAIGESISRLIEASGAEVKRANYQGDVGLHVAKAIYGMMVLKSDMPAEKNVSAKSSSMKNGSAKSDDIVSFLGRAYAEGARLYEDDDDAKVKIIEINKKVYDKSDKAVNELYDYGKRASLEHFEKLYKILGTHFDNYFFEGGIAAQGKNIVENNIKNGVFEVSNGAVVFHGEKYGGGNNSNLHTRVFINKDGLPTYEAKEIGLIRKKFELISPDLSISVTASEQSDYFKVVLKAVEQIYPEIAAKTLHIAHGMLVLPTGKMSSRTGKVVTGESLIIDTIAQVKEKMLQNKMSNDHPNDHKDIKDDSKIAQQVAIAAIKYAILRQSPGKDIVYDVSKSLSLEGDSGPYLQYSAVRARSVTEKAKASGIKASVKIVTVGSGDTMQSPEEISKSYPGKHLERLLRRFPEIVELATREILPSAVATYLTQIAAAFNAFYANEQIVSQAADAPYKVALTSAFAYTMRSGLWMLGIETPDRM